MSVKLELLIPLIALGFVVSSTAAFLAELLESGIGAQRVPDWIEPKKGRRDGRWAIKPATIRRLYQSRQSCDRTTILANYHLN